MSRQGELYKINHEIYKRYFQFVAIDQTTLNSDVIAVFNNSDATDIDSIINSGVEFFMHTSINAGIQQKLWTKIGKAGIVDFSKALFKEVDYKRGLPDIEPYESNSYHSWIIWHINEDWVPIGANIEAYPNATLGAVYPPDETVYRIIHGKHSGLPYYGQVK